MDNEKLVVKAKQAKLGRTLLGGVQVVYPCPRCRDELITKNDVSLGDTCPRCKTSFEFEDEIKGVFAKFEAQKKQQAEAQAAAQAEKEKIRQAKQEERARLAAQQDAEAQERGRETYAAEAARQRDAAQARKQDEEKAARDVSAPYGCLVALLVLGWLASGGMVFVALLFAGNSSPSAREQAIVETLLILGVSSAVSLAVIYVFFRLLRAIHAMLVAILDQLNSSSD